MHHVDNLLTYQPSQLPRLKSGHEATNLHCWQPRSVRQNTKEGEEGKDKKDLCFFLGGGGCGIIWEAKKTTPSSQWPDCIPFWSFLNSKSHYSLPAYTTTSRTGGVPSQRYRLHELVEEFHRHPPGERSIYIYIYEARPRSLPSQNWGACPEMIKNIQKQ